MVTSPYLSRITESREQFVVFEADDKSQSNDEIQTDTLRKILNADAVYVYDLEGYVGKTTCYEIGILMAKNKPLYYLEMPIDLPVPISTHQIISPNEFAQSCIDDKLDFLLPIKKNQGAVNALESVFGISSTKNIRNLMICGSMAFFDTMKQVKFELEQLGIRTIIPEDESHLPSNLSEESFNRFKRKVSRDYLTKIRESGTTAILVLNETKKGIDNYIGANTLAEIVMAFSWGRKIFIFNDFYTPLADELIAWECTPINRDLSIINDFFVEGTRTKKSDIQLSLFDEV